MSRCILCGIGAGPQTECPSCIAQRHALALAAAEGERAALDLARHNIIDAVCHEQITHDEYRALLNATITPRAPLTWDCEVT
jgi:hypothetical protein